MKVALSFLQEIIPKTARLPTVASRPNHHQGRRTGVARPVVVVVVPVVVIAIAAAEDPIDVPLPGGVHPGPRAVRGNQRRRTMLHAGMGRGRTRNRARRRLRPMFDSIRRLQLTRSGSAGATTVSTPSMRSGKASCGQSQTSHEGHHEFINCPLPFAFNLLTVVPILSSYSQDHRSGMESRGRDGAQVPPRPCGSRAIQSTRGQKRPHGTMGPWSIKTTHI